MWQCSTLVVGERYAPTFSRWLCINSSNASTLWAWAYFHHVTYLYFSHRDIRCNITSLTCLVLVVFALSLLKFILPWLEDFRISPFLACTLTHAFLLLARSQLLRVPCRVHVAKGINYKTNWKIWLCFPQWIWPTVNDGYIRCKQHPFPHFAMHAHNIEFEHSSTC